MAAVLAVGEIGGKGGNGSAGAMAVLDYWVPRSATAVPLCSGGCCPRARGRYMFWYAAMEGGRSGMASACIGPRRFYLRT